MGEAEASSRTIAVVVLWEFCGCGVLVLVVGH